jgi:DNA-directed RNA polymerase subunit beta'
MDSGSLTPELAFEQLKKKTVDAIQSYFPFEGKKRRVVVSNVHVDDKLSVDDIASQSDAKDREGTWGVPVKADIKLVDTLTGQIIDEKKSTSIARLPKLTNRYSYIVGGNEYQVDHLFRLKSGVYARVQDNGDLESEFSLKKSPASNRFSVKLDRLTKKFSLKYGDAHIGLYPVLKSLGVADDDIEKSWGKEIFAANRPKTEAKFHAELAKFYKRTADEDPEGKSLDDLHKHVQAFFDQTQIRPDTTALTLGKPFTKVTGETLHLAAHKLLGVSKGTEKPDDRDALPFKEIVSIEDFIPEKIHKAARQIKPRLRQTVDTKGSVQEVLSTDLFNIPIRDFFLKGGSMCERSDQTNPIQMLSSHRKTTLMAKDFGGIKSEMSLTNEMRGVSQSHMGFLDPIQTPECHAHGTEVFTRRGWVVWHEVTEDDSFLCQQDGKAFFSKADRIIREYYRGLMYGMTNGKVAYLVTPNHRIWHRPYAVPGESRLRFDTADLVHGRPRLFPVAHPPARTEDLSEFSPPVVEGDSKTKNVSKPIDMFLWAEFLGWFLSEGSSTFDETKGQYKVSISQNETSNPEKYERIRALLSRLPFGEWGEDPGRGFYIGKKQLASYLKQFGYCHEKYIPDYIFSASIDARDAFIEAMLLGDGRTFSKRKERSYRQKVFCTTSPRLAADFEKLATMTGYSVSTKSYPDKREDRYFDTYEVRLLRHRERAALPNEGHYYTHQYDGTVYCATVPGGVLFTRLPGCLGIWSGNSERTGITLNLAAAARKNGNDLEVPVFNLKTGKPEYLNVTQFHASHVVLPDQVTWKNGKPSPISAHVKMKKGDGDIEERAFHEAQYVLPSAKGMFGYASNSIPFLNANNGNRAMMADKQLEQAISLKHREAPLVQCRTDHPTDPEHTFEKLLGHYTATRSPVDGVVHSVKAGMVKVKGTDGKLHEVHLYDNFPLNDAKGMMHSEVVVKPGDKLKKGQLVADNNFTKDGTLAIGTNLRIGYLPYKGYNYEDGIVISETAAKKLTSEHLYKKELEVDPDKDHVSKAKFLAWNVTKSNHMSKEHLDSLDDDGVIKVGTHVQPGQVLVAAVGKNEAKRISPLAAYGKRAFQPFKDKSLVWDEDHVGVVTKIVRKPGGRGINVHVRTDEPAVIGDKLTGRHGNKGIITQILPDHEMPHTGTGDSKRPLEVVLNPSGIPTRINVGQVLETAAAKVAEKTGKPWLVNNFPAPDHDFRKQVVDDLKKHGLTDEEAVYDPKDQRRPLGSVLVGPQYILKLKHQVEKKLSARGGGTDLQGRALPNDIDRQPVKGGEKGGQGVGALELYALLGHNARHNIREMATYKSDQQDMTFWNLIQEGHEPPPPKVPFSYHKFSALLNGLGVNVTKEGTMIRLHPMTNAQILAMAGNGKNEIKEGAKTLRAKDLKPEPGGLFDPFITGGIDGDKWSFIRLAEPVPNPIFCGQNNKPGPVPVLLGLKLKELDEVMVGKRSLEGQVGGKAVEAALKKINVHGEISKLKTELTKLHGAELDRANKKLKYLLALKENNLSPHEAYVLHYVPVLPPKFRPATSTPTGDVNYSSLNGLYKNISLLNDEIKAFDPKAFSEEHKHPLRGQLWDMMKALESVGTYRPAYDTDSSGNRELKGILHQIAGDQPKEGYFQSKLVKRRQNLAIRSTIVPEPSLHLDEVGLPRNAAMEMYKPFVVAQLHKWGLDPLRAQDEMKKNTELANKALDRAVSERPMLLKRDPVLHKFGVMAFQPKLIEGKAIQIHPLVCGGYNADFDGDAMAGTLPISKEAVEEARKMFPSKNIFSPTNYGTMYVPNQEALLGLHIITKWGKDSGKTFKNVTELEKAVDEGKLHITDVAKVAGFKKPTTLGRILFESRMPRGFEKSHDILHNPDFVITKKTLKGELAPLIARKHTSEYAKVVDSLKDLGNEHSFKQGYSLGLKDFETLPERDAIVAEADRKVVAIRKQNRGEDHERDDIIKVYADATKKIEEAQRSLPKRGNRLATMVLSGARGDPEQLRQMIAAPMLVEDANGKVVATPIKKSFSEGLDVGEYWTSQFGARKGIIQRTRGTAEPGAISKDIINSSMSTLIISPDCKTSQGVLMELGNQDITDRFTATAYKVKGGTIPAGTLITPEVLARLKNNKHEKVLVRSPLKCEHGQGLCAKCFGLNESGRLHDVGINIGILAAQSMGEPSSQLSMSAFHSGGVASGAGAKSLDAISRLRNLLEMPKKLRDEATVATATGKITDIKKDAAGGHDVFVNGVRHYVPAGLVKEDLKIGQEVRKGDQISLGFVNPHKLLEATGDIHAVQNYLTNELHGSLFGGLGVRKRNVEVAVRNITNLARVRDPGKSSEYAPGDIVPRTVLEEHNRKHNTGIIHEPVLKGTGEIPHLITSDWMQRLNYQQLHTTIQSAAARGEKSDIHSSHPIPAVAYGAELGRPSPGKPKHVY